MINEWDYFCVGIAKAIVSKWNKITGHTNYMLARGLFTLGRYLRLAIHITITISQAAAGYYVTATIFAILTLFLHINDNSTYKTIVQLEELFTKGSNVLPERYKVIRLIINARIDTFLPLLFLVFSPFFDASSLVLIIPICISFWLAGIALYVVFIHTKTRKSALSEMKNRAKIKASNLKGKLTPFPSPIPLPIKGI